MALRERLVKETTTAGSFFGRATTTDDATAVGGPQLFQEMKARLHRAIINRMDLTKLGQLEPDQLHAEVARLAEELIAVESVPLSSVERERLVGEVRHELFGLGP